ncbi:MAG TPA: MoaD/ThiS family protein [Gallionellaceae bacterium]|nr:MoaD/ThiS family protein [Gallionellaceae bacterium]
MVKLLYFMKLADLIGSSQEELMLPDGVASIAGLLAWLVQRGEHYQTALGDGSRLQITINKKFVDSASAVKQGDEVAFFPRGR